MKVKATVESIEVLEKNGQVITASVKVKKLKPVLSRFGKLGVSKKYSGFIVRDYDSRWPLEKGVDILLTDEELKDLITPVEFEKFIMIPDNTGLITNTLILRGFKNIKLDYLTLVTSDKEELAKIYLEPAIDRLNISFSSFKNYSGPVILKEFKQQVIGYITSVRELNSGIKLPDKSEPLNENLVTTFNQYLKLKINPETGARLENLELYNTDYFNFFSYFPMYRKTSDLYLMGIETGIQGKDVIDPVHKKFKQDNTKKIEFSLKKKGFLFSKEFSLLKTIPVTRIKFKIQNTSKKQKKYSLYYNADLFFSIEPDFKRLVFRDLEGVQEFNFSQIWMFWDGNHYYKIKPPMLVFLDKETGDIIIIIWKSRVLKEVSIGSDHFGLRLKYIEKTEKLKPGKSKHHDMFIVQGRLLYRGKNLTITVPGRERTTLLSIPFEDYPEDNSKIKLEYKDKVKTEIKSLKLFGKFKIRYFEFKNEETADYILRIGKRKIRLK